MVSVWPSGRSIRWPMITAVGERVRSLVPNHAKRDADRLDDSLREVRRLDEANKGIEVHWRRRANCGYFVEKLQRVEERYAQTQSNEDLEAVLLAECLMEKAKRRATVAQQQITFGIISEEFRAKCSNQRDALQKAVELQVRVATAELNRITAKETERLRAAGFDAETAKQSPIIKRAAN